MNGAVILADPRPVTDKTGVGHQDALDGLRAVAIAAVVLTHVAWATGNGALGGIFWTVVANGTVGVPIFFALSGLLLYRPWARAALRCAPVPRTRPYLRRRALRILPAYWVLLVVTMVVFNRGHLSSIRTWLEMVTLTQNYDPHPWWEQALGPNQMAPIWSLSVEATFYLVLPLLAAVLHRHALGGGVDGDLRARRLLSGLVAVMALSYAATAVVRFGLPYRWIFFWEHLLPRSLPYFGAGMIVAVLSEWAGQTRSRPVLRLVSTVGSMPGAAWLVAICAMVLAATPLATPVPGIPQIPQNGWQYLAVILLFTVVATALIAPVAFQPAHPMTKAVLGNRVMRRIGSISYGVFLWHQFVLGGWYYVTGRPIFDHDFGLVLVVTVAGSLVVAALSYVLIERPAQRLR